MIPVKYYKTPLQGECAQQPIKRIASYQRANNYLVRNIDGEGHLSRKRSNLSPGVSSTPSAPPPSPTATSPAASAALPPPSKMTSNEPTPPSFEGCSCRSAVSSRSTIEASSHSRTETLLATAWGTKSVDAEGRRLPTSNVDGGVHDPFKNSPLLPYR